MSEDGRTRFTLPAIFKGVKRLADDSVNMTFVSSQQLDSVQFGTLDMLRRNLGYLQFAMEKEELPELPPEPPKEEGGKTWNERVRAVLFLIWRDKTDQTEPFEVYKNRRREQLLSKLKGELDD